MLGLLILIKEVKLLNKYFQPLVSVIIPVYNSESTIEKCINSLLKQIYDNFEIIVINDGSRDNSLKKLNELSKRDNRIKIINQSNSGRSVARNKGIDISSGEYITFLDSDDYVGSKYLLYLVKGIACGADISMVNAVCVDSTGIVINNKKNYSNSFSIMDAQDAIKAVLYQKPDNTVWGKMFRKDLFDVAKFPKGKIYEDLYITFLLMCMVSKISFQDTPEYFYSQREDNTINGKFSKKKMDILTMGEQARLIIMDKYPELECEVACRLFAAYSNVWMQVSKKKYIDEYNLLWSKIKKYRLKLLFSKIGNKKVFFGVYASLFGEHFYRFIYKKLKGVLFN